MEKVRDVKIKTGIEPSFLVETLTTDIELTDALFDLIDNSIDAARDKILLADDVKFDDYGLPADYSSCEVIIRFTDNSITVKDNCAGFNESTLTNTAFITGKRSNHQFGIGHYGLGLKRALLKVGGVFGLVTDNGVSNYRAVFNSSSFATNGKNEIPAKRFDSKSKSYTLFTVSDLFQDIKYQIKDDAWFAYALKKISVRYGLFIQKGLSIKVTRCILNCCSTQIVGSSIPSIRVGAPLIPFMDKINNFDGINVYFNVGVHEGYRFSGETDHDTRNNSLISGEYGLYFISNDRVIVDASIDKKYGFTTSWHNEYSGFICLIRMVGDNPGKLPWNTAKTELKLGSTIFLAVKDKIEVLAKQYRARARHLIKIWKGINDDPSLSKDERKTFFSEKTGITLPRVSKSSTSTALDGSGLSEASVCKLRVINAEKLNDKSNGNLQKTAFEAKDLKKRAESNRDKHSQNWKTLIPPNFPISDDDQVLDNLIIESIDLEIGVAPHASAMLYRSIIEAASKRFIKKHGLFKAVKDYYYLRGEGKRKNHNEEYKQSQGVDLNMIADWLVAQSDIFPLDDRKQLKLSSKKIKEHISTLNGIVHGVQLTNASQLSIIRNDTIAIVRFLVT